MRYGCKSIDVLAPPENILADTGVEQVQQT